MNSKKLIVLSFLLAGSLVFSQREVKVGNFSKVTSFDQIDVILIKTDGEPKVVLSGDGSEDVEIVEKNFELKIRMPLLKLLKGDNVSATVFYNKEVSQFEANEGSRISSNDFFNAANLRFIAKEGSEIQLKIETNKVSAKVTNGSKVTLSGTAKSQDVVTSTGGIYEAEKLITGQTLINSNTGGNASIHATELADVKILAGGVITIYGDPKRISQKITGGGKIVQVK